MGYEDDGMTCPTSDVPEAEIVERRVSRAVIPREGLRDLLSISPAREPILVAIRGEQLRELVRLTPLAQLLAIFTVLLMGWELRHAISWPALIGWMMASIFVACARIIRAKMLKLRIERQIPPNALAETTVLVAVAALLWVVPPLLWSPMLPQNHQIMIGMVLLGLMSSGATSLGIAPMAALVFILVLGVAQVRMTIYHESIAETLLAATIPLSMIQSILANGRVFIRQINSRVELEEQGQLISLLREFQSSGSDWLWELDADLNIRYLSLGMARSIGRPVAELIGTSARKLIDPGNRHSALSEGARALFAAIGGGQSFHELAFPTIDGKRWFCMSGRPVRDEWRVITGWRGVASDITLQRAGEGTDSIKIARRDPLTGLGNRLLVREMIEEARLRQIAGDGQCVLLLLDLDRFKLVNDTLGHAVGDQLLIEVARRITAVCEENAGVARLGGDEFAVVWRAASDTLTLVTLAEAIVATMNEGYIIGATPIHVGASIGIARAPIDGLTEGHLMRSADLALYRAKEQGRGCSAFYEPWMLAKVQADRLLENDVREAVRRGELHLAYQPILDAASMDVVGHEALLRWSHPQRGSISPDVFIPIIEDVGLIHQIGDWVIREACRQAATWSSEWRVAVNVSVAQLTGAGLHETVAEALRESGLAPHRLEIEVTESVFMGDDTATLGALSNLRSLGVRLVLDDFGTGYSSFGYLTHSFFAKIKIDQMFVRAAANGQRESMAIVGSILALAKGLGVETTAEGIETAAQAELMAHLGCSQLQGFLFGRPMSADAVRQAQHRPSRRPYRSAAVPDPFPAWPTASKAPPRWGVAKW